MIVEPYDFSSPFNSRKRHFIPSALSNENQIEVRQLNGQRQVTDNKESDTNKSVRYFNNDEISGRTGAGSSCKAAAEQRIETVETSGSLSYSRGVCFLTSDRIGELCLVCGSVLGLFPGAILAGSLRFQAPL